MKECYKFYIHDELQAASRPLFLGCETLAPPYDSREYRPATQYYLFKYTISGCGLVGSGDRVWPLPPGTAMFYRFPCEQHHFYLEDGMADWHSIYLEFDAGGLEDMLDDWVAKFGVVYSLTPEAEGVRRLLAYREKFYKFDGDPGAVTEYRRYGNNIHISGAEGAQLVLQLLADLRERRDTVPAGNDNILNAACEYIRRNISKPFTIEQLAEELELSRGYLTRIFTDKTGVSPHEYVVAVKMRQACQLLAERKIPVSMVAERIGVTSEIYFYRMFKRVTGLTPGEFRRSEQQEEIIRKI